MLERLIHFFEKKTIHRKGVYLIPNKWGLIFFLLIGVIFYIGMSYANNIMLTFSFFLLSYFLILLVLAHFNLYGHQWDGLKIEDCYAECSPILEVFLKPFALTYPRDIVFTALVDKHMVITFSSLKGGRLKDARHSFVSNPLPRGMYRVKKLKVSSAYPLSLFHVWHYLDEELHFYIYPVIGKKSQITFKSFDNGKQSQSAHLVAGHEFFQHGHYQGGSRQRIDWKVYAKKDELLIKHYQISQGKNIHINWHDFSESDVEQKLSFMAKSVHHCYLRGLSWSLSLPGGSLNEASGREHYKKSLQLLSCHA